MKDSQVGGIRRLIAMRAEPGGRTGMTVWSKESAVRGSGMFGRVVRVFRARCLITVLLTCAVPGCANFWDDVTSRDFQFKQLFSKPNPLVVLQNSTDGDQRARALHALGEPKQYGGSDSDQDTVLRILTAAAVSDSQFLCRLAAIDSLGNFHDPRAVTALTQAFYNSGSFPPDMANRIQCQAIAAVGHTENSAGVGFLLKVLQTDPADGAEQEKQHDRDLRLAAAKALGHFHGVQVAEALVGVLKTDKDVAMCDCAFESLQESSHQRLASDFRDWNGLIQTVKAQETNPKTAGPDFKTRLVGWISQPPRLPDLIPD